jgi:hypothetical protein
MLFVMRGLSNKGVLPDFKQQKEPYLSIGLHLHSAGHQPKAINAMGGGWWRQAR